MPWQASLYIFGGFDGRTRFQARSAYCYCVDVSFIVSAAQKTSHCQDLHQFNTEDREWMQALGEVQTLRFWKSDTSKMWQSTQICKASLGKPKGTGHEAHAAGRSAFVPGAGDRQRACWTIWALGGGLPVQHVQLACLYLFIYSFISFFLSVFIFIIVFFFKYFHNRREDIHGQQKGKAKTASNFQAFTSKKKTFIYWPQSTGP